MVTKFAAFASISNNCAWSTPCSHDFVIGFVLRYDDIRVNDVSDFAEHIFCLSINILRSLILSFDSFVESLRLGLLLGNISFLISFLLSCCCLGDVSFLFSQIVQSVFRCNQSKRANLVCGAFRHLDTPTFLERMCGIYLPVLRYPSSSMILSTIVSSANLALWEALTLSGSPPI